MKKILIVDDVPEYLNSLSRALSREFEVYQASSLEQAKEVMVKGEMDIQLALVDVRLSEEDMSNRDGILFLGWLKEGFPDIPVVMMSAYRDFDSAVDAINLGASRYVKKPINVKELRQIIRSLTEDSIDLTSESLDPEGGGLEW